MDKSSKHKMLAEALEELDDICAYDEAISQPDEVIPFEQAVRKIEEGTSR